METDAQLETTEEKPRRYEVVNAETGESAERMLKAFPGPVSASGIMGIPPIVFREDNEHAKFVAEQERKEEESRKDYRKKYGGQTEGG